MFVKMMEMVDIARLECAAVRFKSSSLFFDTKSFWSFTLY